MIVLHGELDGEKREAWFSECGLYRYLLDIVWDSSLPMMTTIALNPSKASHLVNDNTIVRCKKFARLRGFGGYRMLNAFALRSTNPKQLFVAKDPVGRENTIDFLTAHRTPMTIAAWGATIQSRRWKYWYRGHEIAGAIRDLMCFKKTAEGHPFHPLYLSWDVEPVPFSYA